MNEEDIAATIMMPAVLRAVFRDPAGIEDMDACLKTCESYSSEIDRFALSSEDRGPEFYASFREVLSRYSPIFQEDYASVDFMTDAQIDTALEKVKKAREEKNTLSMKCIGSVDTES